MAITTLNNRSINRSDTASADQVWTATSATASDFQAGGLVLQVVTGTTTSSVATSSTTPVTSGLTADITPSATSSKIMIICLGGEIDTGADGRAGSPTIYRDATNLGNGDTGMGSVYATSSRIQGIPSVGYLDSPSSASQITYALYFRSGGGDEITFNANACKASIILMEVAG